MSDPRPGAGAGRRVGPPLRIAVVGPSHPLKGGVAAHTTTLAHELAAAGHDVVLVSWSQLYPALLYPGVQGVPGGVPDVPPYPRTVRVLSWSRPGTWVRTGRRLRGMDAIVVVHIVPPVVPAHLTLLRAAQAVRSGAAGPGPRSLVVAHNVLPHEPRPGDRQLVRALFRRAGPVIVHSPEQARLAAELGAARVCELGLPPHLPGGERLPHAPGQGRTRLLCLGIVREYKGVDMLLEAARDVPGIEVTVAGELWGESGRRVGDLAADPRLRGRVEIHDGYVPADRIAGLMARHDVVALTYREATASQNVLLAHRHGLPVLATDVGTFGREVTDGVDGILVPQGDRGALGDALRRLAEPGYAASLRAAVVPPDLHGPWRDYVRTVEDLAGAARRAGTASGGAATGSSREALAPPAGSRRRIWAAVAEAANSRPARRVLDLRPGDFPEWVRVSDILSVEGEALVAKALARRLGLPRCADPVSNWAALGALAAIVRMRENGSPSRIAEESGAGSPLSRWARAAGFTLSASDLGRRPVGACPDGPGPARLDILARVHPGGCTAYDVDGLLERASRVLRRGGLLIVTIPVGEGNPRWSVSPADVRGVLARADDLGLGLVGDLDGDITDRMRRAAAVARTGHAGGRPARGQAAYGILRLTFRRR